MTSLGIGSELASSSIKKKTPRYPHERTVEVTLPVKAMTALTSGPLVRGALTKTSAKNSIAKYTMKATANTIMIICGALRFSVWIVSEPNGTR